MIFYFFGIFSVIYNASFTKIICISMPRSLMYFSCIFDAIQFSCIKKKTKTKITAITSLFKTYYFTDYMIDRYESVFICWLYEFKLKS